MPFYSRLSGRAVSSPELLSYTKKSCHTHLTHQHDKA